LVLLSLLNLTLCVPLSLKGEGEEKEEGRQPLLSAPGKSVNINNYIKSLGFISGNNPSCCENARLS
jgi:hypothetical protein